MLEKVSLSVLLATTWVGYLKLISEDAFNLQDNIGDNNIFIDI